MASFIEKIFGTHSEHEVKRVIPLVEQIEALEPEYEKLTDALAFTVQETSVVKSDWNIFAISLYIVLERIVIKTLLWLDIKI